MKSAIQDNSTAIEVYFEKEIEPVSLGTLNKHPKLKNIYFYKKMLNRLLLACHKYNLKQFIMSANDGLKCNLNPFLLKMSLIKYKKN